MFVAKLPCAGEGTPSLTVGALMASLILQDFGSAATVRERSCAPKPSFATETTQAPKHRTNLCKILPVLNTFCRVVAARKYVPVCL